MSLRVCGSIKWLFWVKHPQSSFENVLKIEKFLNRKLGRPVLTELKQCGHESAEAMGRNMRQKDLQRGEI